MIEPPSRPTRGWNIRPKSPHHHSRWKEGLKPSHHNDDWGEQTNVDGSGCHDNSNGWPESCVTATNEEGAPIEGWVVTSCNILGNV